GQWRDPGRFQGSGVASPAWTRGAGSRGALQHDFAQGVPDAALGALALPFGMLAAAFGADVGGTRLGHVSWDPRENAPVASFRKPVRREWLLRDWRSPRLEGPCPTAPPDHRFAHRHVRAGPR